MVLRPRHPIQAASLLERLAGLGLLHVEIGWQPVPHWSRQCGELIASFPALRLGAASVSSPEAIDAAASAGFRYALAPVLEPALLQQAAAAQMTLVPGVMSPTEVHRAMALGCRLVKLFPAAALGRTYWSRLRDPLGSACSELPFCIAAGGLGPEDVLPWLEEGVGAVTLGSRWFGWPEAGREGAAERGVEGFDAELLRHLLANLASRRQRKAEGPLPS